MPALQILALLLAALFVIGVMAVLLLVNFTRAGPPGPPGPPGDAGTDAKAVAYKNLLLDTSYSIAGKAYVCSYPSDSRAFYAVYPFDRAVNPTYNGYSMTFVEPPGTPASTANVATLFSNYVRETSVFAISNASSKPLYLNLVGFNDPTGRPYLYDDLFAEQISPDGTVVGVCKAAPDQSSPPRYSAYSIPAGQSRLFTFTDRKLAILTF